MEKQKLSQTTWFTITMLIVFFPVGIYLMWKNKKFKNNRRIVITTFFFIGCVLAYTGNDHDSQTIPESTQVIESQLESNTDTENDITKQDDIDVLQNDGVVSEDKPDEQEKSDDQTETVSTTNSEKKTDNKSDSETFEYKGKSYQIIEVDGGDLSGKREPNVAVDIGFGAREYWALANEYGKLVCVMADKLILQVDENEPVTSKGRYYSDEAKVPGVERDDLDEGHIIADSLGGVSNAYNITPKAVL